MQFRTLGILAVALATVMLGLTGAASAEAAKESPGVISNVAKMVKDIFYVPEAQPMAAPTPAQPLELALKYKILLRRGDYVSIVPETFVFTKGDQFRLIFEGNATGHVYIFNKGTSGSGAVLFPDKRINGGHNVIAAHVETVVPGAGWYEFDEKPGTEQLFVFYSPKKLADLEAPVRTGEVQETLWQQVVTTMMERRTRSVKAGTTKDIVYVEEGQTVVPEAPAPATPAAPVIAAAQPNYSTATYVGTQTSEPDGLLIHVIKLNHQ